MPQYSNNWQMSVFKWNFRWKPPTSIHSPTHSAAKFVPLKCCHDRTCHKFFSHKLHSLDTPLSTGVQVGWKSCPQELPEKGQGSSPGRLSRLLSYWEAEPVLLVESQHLMLSPAKALAAPFSLISCSRTSFKGLLWQSPALIQGKTPWGGNLGYQSRCCNTIARQRRISRALQTSLLFSSSLNKAYSLNNTLAAQFMHMWVSSHSAHSHLYQATHHRISKHPGLTTADLRQKETFTRESQSRGKETSGNSISNAVTC